MVRYGKNKKHSVTLGVLIEQKAAIIVSYDSLPHYPEAHFFLYIFLH